MSQPIQPRALGYLPRHLDPFGLIGGRAQPSPWSRLRFEEGGENGGGDEPNGGDLQLGDAGKQALDRMKGERNAARDELKSFKELGLTVDEIKALKGQTPVDEAALEKRLRASIEKDNQQQTAARLRVAEVKAQAVGLGFIKPQQALALLDAAELAKVSVADDGQVDEAAVKKLLEALATDSPHLVSKDTTPGHQVAGIGASGGGAKPEVGTGQSRMAAAYASKSKQ